MKSLWKNRWVVLILILSITVCAVGGMVYAKYVADMSNKTGINITAVGKLNMSVTGPAKEVAGDTYTITNSDASNMPAYVRVAVVVNWQDANGNVWATPPVEGTDYTVEASDCTKHDGYYYFNGTRKPGENFSVKINPVTSKTGYTLHVQILAEGIQCVPASTAQTAWGATFESGSWEKT